MAFHEIKLVNRLLSALIKCPEHRQMYHTNSLQFLQVWRSNSLFWNVYSASAVPLPMSPFAQNRKEIKAMKILHLTRAKKWSLCVPAKKGGWWEKMEVARWEWWELEEARTGAEGRTGENFLSICSSHAEMSWFDDTHQMNASILPRKWTSGVSETTAWSSCEVCYLLTPERISSHV